MLAIMRSSIDRRTGKDRRRIFMPTRFFFKGSERRKLKERRLQKERRRGWVRVGKWSSVFLRDLKIAKFLK